MKDRNRNRIELVLLFSLLVIFLPGQYSVTDMIGYWLKWALEIHNYGLMNIYDHSVNVHPGFPYVLYVYDLIMGSNEQIIAHINYLKLFPLLFDFLPVVVLCCFKQRLIEEKIPFFFLLLNIAYLYNSLIWGQYDSAYTALCFLAILTALYNPVIAVILYTIGFFVKFQSIMLLPVMIVVLFYSINNLKTLGKTTLALLTTSFVFLFPFILEGKVNQVFYVTAHYVDFMNHVSVQAYNIWYLIVQGSPYDINDTSTFFVLSYKQTGLLLFFLFTTITLIPLLKQIITLKFKNQKPDKTTKELLMITAGLVSYYFFYFNTQMHERYVHPTLIFFFFYAVYSRNYRPYILVSIAYFLSLEKTLPNFLPFPHPRFIFGARIIAVIYTLNLAYTMFVFFRKFKPIVGLSQLTGFIKNKSFS